MTALVTVWCAECQGASDVVEEGPQTDPFGVEWWARLLDCEHEETRRISA